MGGKQDKRQQPGQSGKGPDEMDAQHKRPGGQNPTHHQQPGQPAKPSRGKGQEADESTRRRDDDLLREEDLHDDL